VTRALAENVRERARAKPAPAAENVVMGRLLIVVFAVLVVASAYEAAVALEWISLGGQPGDGPVGGGVVLALALLAMIVGAAVLARRTPSSVWSALIAPAAAAFVVARFYTFDPYYLPTMRRISDNGLVTGALVYALVASAVLAGVATIVRPRIGGLASVIVLVLCALTALVEAGGH
jgi:hypothetical protein